MLVEQRRDPPIGEVARRDPVASVDASLVHAAVVPARELDFAAVGPTAEGCDDGRVILWRERRRPVAHRHKDFNLVGVQETVGETELGRAG